MGTSHRHTPTVKGEPNWGQASAAVSGLAGAVILSDELEENPPVDLTPAQVVRKQASLGKQINRSYHRAVRHLVSAAGGRAKVSSGSSRAVGHAGLYVIGNLVSTLEEIVKNGLLDWLRNNGIVSIEGKSCHDIIDIIRKFIDTEVTGLDATAANEALEFVLDSLEDKMGDDIDKFDEIMNEIMGGEEIKNMLDLFFGMYIYSHLSQDFEEKLEYEKGSEAMKNAMNEIKDQIIDDISSGRVGRDVASVDWSKPEGDAFIKAEFDRILFILQGNED